MNTVYHSLGHNVLELYEMAIGKPPPSQVLNASADVGECCLGSLHAEEPGGALKAVDELAQNLIRIS